MTISLGKVPECFASFRGVHRGKLMNGARYSPNELYSKFRSAHDLVTPREFYSKPIHKKTQELYCAARFAQAFSQIGECWIHVSDVDEQTVSDFHLEFEGRKFPFQVTEVQIPGRKRGDEYKADQLPRATVESWDFGTENGPIWIRDAVRQKHDCYGGDVGNLNLLVYANFQAYEQDFEQICQASESAAAKFASVWIVNGNGACCIKCSVSLGGRRPWLFSEFMQTDV